MMIPLQFRPTQWDVRVQSVCQSWEGTPWRHNRCVKKAGVDCLHFAAAVLDELYGEEHSKDLQSLPIDACIHNKLGVMAAARALFEKYPEIVRVNDGYVESGDLVILGRDVEIDSTQHLMVAGGRGCIWHADPPKVYATGLVAPEHLKLVCVYRATNKEIWPC